MLTGRRHFPAHIYLYAAEDIVQQTRKPAISDTPAITPPQTVVVDPASTTLSAEKRRLPLPIGPTGRLNPKDF
jgi:hypothetical protein